MNSSDPITEFHHALGNFIERASVLRIDLCGQRIDPGLDGIETPVDRQFKITHALFQHSDMCLGAALIFAEQDFSYLIQFFVCNLPVRAA
ncbi:MAG: hypothetical protein AAFY53_01660 [Pseudomonadota bacterium]